MSYRLVTTDGQRSKNTRCLFQVNSETIIFQPIRKCFDFFRMERDLHKRTDQFGQEMRERLKWDIREGVIGADTFNPKHSVIVTWKNMSFTGGIDNSLYTTNTFQLVLATDEVYTYAIFNYLDIQWSSHTEAGGDTTKGEGGVPAYVSVLRFFSVAFVQTCIFIDWFQCWQRNSKLRIQTLFSNVDVT